MLERPPVSDDTIASALRDHYALAPIELEFLPIGNDSSSAVFRVTTSIGPYFLKLRSGPLYLPSLTVPYALRQAGISQVVAPLLTQADQLYAPLPDRALILYPYIQGQTAMDAGMTDGQWAEFGQALARIHSANLPNSILAQLQREQFKLNPRWLRIAQELQASLPNRATSTPSQQEFAAFWLENANEIEKILHRAVELGQQLRRANLPLVLCHTDIHTANIMVDPQSRLHIIDWDQPLLAPKERDLMFIGNGLLDPIDSCEETWFASGYGSPQVSLLALTYYRYEWVVQEFGDFGERIFSPAYTEITRQDSVRGFKQLFDPTDVVEGALQADALLKSRRE